MVSKYPRSTGLALHLCPLLAPSNIFETEAIPTSKVPRPIKAGMTRLINALTYLGVGKAFVDWVELPSGAFRIAEVHGLGEGRELRAQRRAAARREEQRGPPPPPPPPPGGTSKTKVKSFNKIGGAVTEVLKTVLAEQQAENAQKQSSSNKKKKTIKFANEASQRAAASQKTAAAPQQQRQPKLKDAKERKKKASESAGIPWQALNQAENPVGKSTLLKKRCPRSPKPLQFRCHGDFCDYPDRALVTEKRLLPVEIVRRARLKLQGCRPGEAQIFFQEKAVEVCENCFQEYSQFEKEETHKFRAMLRKEQRQKEEARKKAHIKPAGWKSRIQEDYEKELESDRLRLQEILQDRLDRTCEDYTLQVRRRRRRRRRKNMSNKEKTQQQHLSTNTNDDNYDAEQDQKQLGRRSTDAREILEQSHSSASEDEEENNYFDDNDDYDDDDSTPMIPVLPI